jgi:hypothetical protein
VNGCRWINESDPDMVPFVTLKTCAKEQVFSVTKGTISVAVSLQL